MAPLVGQTVSHYKILEHLGGGGMGVVYKAQDLKLDRLVALKFLPPDLTRDHTAKVRFTHEAKSASAIQHANICVVQDIDQTDGGQMFICMEHLDGETLRKRIERGPVPFAEAVAMARQVAQGLSKAHEAGIIHRDIKPANIIVTKDGVAKILDFGLAKISTRTLLTKEGSTLGTAAYMSPEQARGEEVDQRADIWALGVVLYELCTGQLPFPGGIPDGDRLLDPERESQTSAGTPSGDRREARRDHSHGPAEGASETAGLNGRAQGPELQRLGEGESPLREPPGRGADVRVPPPPDKRLPPFQTVVYFPGSWAEEFSSSDSLRGSLHSCEISGISSSRCLT